MKRRACSQRRWRQVGLSLLSMALAAHGLANDAAVRPNERLSDWLLRQTPSEHNYFAGLSWRVPAARAAQAELKQRLLAQLFTGEGLDVGEDVRYRLANWLRALAPTGRAPIRIADARWLQAHPEHDPVLDRDHAVILPRRPRGLSVLMDGATICRVAHRAATEARAFLRSCRPDLLDDVDKLWLVQPDGKVQVATVAEWNAAEHDLPAPGAWIWAPSRHERWPESFSLQLAHFLATQGPALDEPAEPAAEEKLLAAIDADVPRSRSPIASVNDWGLVGLLQTPTARMAESGDMRFHFSRVYPYGRGNVMFQPVDWLEAGFRYSNISNQRYGDKEFSGEQAYKDKSLDFKIRVLNETATRPQVAFGVTDIGGTGLFSSEYVVANKRVGDFDWSAGIAWGYLGGSGNIKNPFTLLSDQFSKRTVEVGSGGTVATGSFFHGNAALFGGVQYHSPWKDLLLKLEYDGNDYRHEPQANNQIQRTPFNLGLTYRVSPSIDVTAGVERGSTWMLGVTVHSGLNRIAMPKILDEPLPAVLATRPSGEPDWARTAADLEAQTQWRVRRIGRKGREVQIVLEQVYGAYQVERLERATTILHRDAPADVDRFVFSFVERGFPLTDWLVLRDEWVDKRTRRQVWERRYEAIAAVEPGMRYDFSTQWAAPAERMTIGIAPNFDQTLGGPDGFVLYQFGITVPAELRFGEQWWASGRLNWRMVDNYDKFKFDPISLLPRVRTHLREYITTSRVTLPNLQVTHVGNFSDNQYYSVYGGLLEMGFAGYGAEWLYRPWQSSFAFGVDLNRVRQRGFKQDFELLDYRVTTGHASAYWETGWLGTQVRVSAGQYLAGDRGVTFDLSRRFANGVTLGGFFTKTNISSETFGEGSFDKGIYVSIPFDAMLPNSSPLNANFLWTPLTRDGGARLGRGTSLYETTIVRDRRASRSASVDSAYWRRDEESDPWKILGDVGDSGLWLTNRLRQAGTMDALLTGGALVLASTALDRPLARWADTHQGGTWDRAGKFANAVPVLLGAGAAALWSGVGDEVAADTAKASLLAAGWTLAADLLVRAGVGRARPEQNTGPFEFSGVAKNSASSGFPSNHMGIAFALVAPFAQRYEAPWLYAVAGATAFGRVQQKQHYFSDVVAGGLIGYGLGALMLERQRHERDARIVVDVQRNERRVGVAWDF